MRILDETSDKALSRITIFLTQAEAAELKDAIESVLQANAHHEHVPSGDYTKEITLCVYEDGKLDAFDERSKKLILQDT
jgi:hypothetical protein